MPEDGARRIAVIGGGIAGLAAAYELGIQARDRGRRFAVDLYESTDRLGGVIRTEREGNFLLDAGPDSMLRAKPWALELCRELGLESEIIPTLEVERGVFIYSRGALRPLPYGAPIPPLSRLWRFVRSGTLSWRGLLRASADLVLPPREAPLDESLAAFFGRRFGREVVERVIDPLLAGIYAGDPSRLSIRSTFPRFADMQERRRSLLLGMLRNRAAAGSGPAFCSLRGGIGQLVEKLASRLNGASVHLRTAVTAVVKENGSYRLRTNEGARDGYASVILAVPAPVASELVQESAAELSKLLRSIRFVSSATVFLAYRRRDLGHDPRGYGFLVPRCEERRVNGGTWVSNKYAGRAPVDALLVRCYVGGDRTGDAMSMDDKELVRACRAELCEMAGIDAEPIFSRVFRFDRSGPQYDVGHARRVDGIDRELRAHPGLFVTGSGYRGIGIPDCIRDGRETGRRVLSYLSA